MTHDIEYFSNYVNSTQINFIFKSSFIATVTEPIVMQTEDYVQLYPVEKNIRNISSIF